MKWLLVVLLTMPAFADEIVREEVRGAKAVRIVVGPPSIGINDDLRVTFTFRGDRPRFALPKVPAGWVRRSTSTPTDLRVEWILRPLIPGEAVPLDLDGIELQSSGDVEATKIDLSEPISIEVKSQLKKPEPGLAKSGYPFEPLDVVDPPSRVHSAIWIGSAGAVALVLALAIRMRRDRRPAIAPTALELLRDADTPGSVEDVRELDGLLRMWLEARPGCRDYDGPRREAERLIWSKDADIVEMRAWWESVRKVIRESGPESPEPR